MILPDDIVAIPEVIIAADRGYINKDIISFVLHLLGAGLIGTHKRTNGFPVVYGLTGVPRTQKGLKRGLCLQLFLTARLSRAGPFSFAPSKNSQLVGHLSHMDLPKRIVSLVSKNLTRMED